MQEEHDRRRKSREAEDAQLGDAIRNGSAQGALDYVLVRHKKFWDENATRIDSLIRDRHLNLVGNPYTRTQRSRAFSDCVPAILTDLASLERVEIRPGLRLERLARIAPDDQNLFAGQWFADELISAFEKNLETKDRHPVEWSTRKEQIADPRERGVAFEHYLKAELEKAGCESVEMTKATGDYGVDLLAVHRSRRIIIQAKSYSDKVSLEAVQEIEAARKLYRASEAWVVTDSEFTPSARRLAAENDVNLIDRELLYLFGPSVMIGHRLSIAEASLVCETTVTPAATGSTMPDESVGQPAAAPIRPGLSASLEPRRSFRRFRQYAVHLGAAASALALAGVLAVWVSSASSKASERSVLAAIDKWVSTTQSLDIDGQLSCYAPVLKTFYRLKNVGVDVVATKKRDAFRRFSEARTYRLRNVQVERLDGPNAAVVFDKDWDFREPKSNRRFAGSGRQRLTLQRFGQSWLITGEEELAVYSVTGSVVGK
jgi:restriction system protein